MNNIRRILIMLIGIISVLNLDAQLLLTEYQAHKIEGEKILIRWEPMSGEEWISSQSIGYSVKKYKILASTGIETLIENESVRPAPIETWYRYEANTTDFLNNFASGARSFIYPEEGKANQLDKLFELEGDKSEGNKLSLGFLLYSATFDFEIAKLAGLGSEMIYEQGYTYRFEIQTGNSKPIIINVDPESFQEKEIPKLYPEWGQNIIKINWDGSQHQDAFLGYMISKSEDGVNFKAINKTPRTNSLGLLPDSSALLQITHTDSLEVNDKTYWFKVEGFDYFGKKSSKSKLISGQGFDEIKMSPIIEYANQTEDNHAHLKWYMPEELEKLVNIYQIVRSDNDEGPYKIAIDSIDKSIKEYKVPLESTQNHFRIMAVPKRGKPVGSVPVFIMGQDTVPPAMPEIIGAFIDSVGVIELKWRANAEQDLWGYRIFKSNFDEQEYALINNVISKDTIYRDTVDINFNTENVFYKIYATDTRDNKSAFTLPIKIEKPDIFPPSMAGFNEIAQKNDTLYINWQASASDDVVSHKIFRRAINLENSWTLVGMLDSTKLGVPFVETELEYGVSYAYTIIAYDEVGLKSEPASPEKITLRRGKEEFDPEIQFSYLFDKKRKEIKLSWDSKESAKIEHIVIYRGTSGNKLGKYKILKGDVKELVDLTSKEEVMYYKIKPIYEDQTKDYFSETIEVLISNE